MSLSNITLNHDKVHDTLNRLNGDQMHCDTDCSGTEMVTMVVFIPYIEYLNIIKSVGEGGLSKRLFFV